MSSYFVRKIYKVSSKGMGYSITKKKKKHQQGSLTKSNFTNKVKHVSFSAIIIHVNYLRVSWKVVTIESRCKIKIQHGGQSGAGA